MSEDGRQAYDHYHAIMRQLQNEAAAQALLIQAAKRIGVPGGGWRHVPPISPAGKRYAAIAMSDDV